jgi:hypothetical protein
MEHLTTQQQCLTIESLDSSNTRHTMKLLTAEVTVAYIICAANKSQFKAAALHWPNKIEQFIVQLLVTIYQNIVEDNAGRQLVITMRSLLL